MADRNDYERLRAEYMSSLDHDDFVKINRVFRHAKPIEQDFGKPAEEFSGAEWNRLLKDSVWDMPATACNIRYVVRRYAAFLQEHNVSCSFDAIEETVGQPAKAWSENFFKSFEEMNRVFASIPSRFGRNNKALALALFSLGLRADEIAELTTDDIDEAEMTVRTESRVIEEVESFVFRFIPLEKGKLIQTNSSHFVTASSVQNIVYRLARYQNVDSPHSLVPQCLAKSYFFLKLEKYEKDSGELIANLSKKEWFYQQCRKWSGTVTNEKRFSSLIREYNRLQRLR